MRLINDLNPMEDSELVVLQSRRTAKVPFADLIPGWFVDHSGEYVEVSDLDASQYLISEEEGLTIIHIGTKHEDGFEVDDTYDLHPYSEEPPIFIRVHIYTNGRAVWVNDINSGCIARFDQIGIEIRPIGQKGGFDKAPPEWSQFVLLLKQHGIDIADSYKPDWAE